MSQSTRPPVPSPSSAASFGATLRAAAGTVIRHVPARGILWALIGLVVGALYILPALFTAVHAFDRGAVILANPVFFAIAPVGGAILLGLHGLHRGAARATLELQAKAGLVRHVVDRVIERLERGDRPDGHLEDRLKPRRRRYLRHAEEIRHAPTELAARRLSGGASPRRYVLALSPEGPARLDREALR